MTTGAIEPTCPLCGGSTFEDVRGRELESCTGCGSLARTRSAWLLLTRHCNVSAAHRIAHFAPERQIAVRLAELCGSGYEAFDLQPEAFPAVPTRRFDLCAELPSLEPDAYDVVIHNHVIEHLPCNYTMVLLGLHNLLKPGGFHIFSCPVQAGHSRCDLNPALPADERQRVFGQADHIRRFGRRDFEQTLGMVFGLTASYSLTDLIAPEELIRANVPEWRWTIDRGTVFAVRKEAGPISWPYAPAPEPGLRQKSAGKFLERLFGRIGAHSG